MNPSALEKLCLKLPGTTVDIKWSHDLCYLVGQKMYCVQTMDGPFMVSFKATPENFEILMERNGIVPAPYSGRNHWVLVEDPGTLRPAEWIQFIQQSYALVAAKLPKKHRPSP